MPTIQPHTVTTNGVQYVHRRRRPDAFDRIFGSLLVAAFCVSALLVVAAGAGAIWLIVVVVQDLVRRLS